MMQEREERPCYDRGNGSPFCSPVASDTWSNGSHNAFVWNYNYPYYVASEYINLFLYYKENYAFQPIKNWTNVHRADGQLAVQVDDTWFPSLLEPGSPNKTWSLYGLYLPAGKDPASELTNPESQYPRPFNFSVVQPSYSSNNPALHPSDRPDGGLPGWAVAVITLGILAAAAAGVAACLIARRRNHKLSSAIPVVADEPQHAKQMIETDSSIYSTTPIVVGTTASNSSTPRLSNQYCNHSSSRRSSGMLPHNRSGLSNCRSSGSFDDTSSRRLADSTFMWMVDAPDNQEDEQRRRKLGEALLAQQLQDEKGASVKHAERRPITVNDGVSGQERHAVFEER